MCQAHEPRSTAGAREPNKLADLVLTAADGLCSTQLVECGGRRNGMAAPHGKVQIFAYFSNNLIIGN